MVYSATYGIICICQNIRKYYSTKYKHGCMSMSYKSTGISGISGWNFDFCFEKTSIYYSTNFSVKAMSFPTIY